MVAVVGKVEKRAGAVNENLATGEIEVRASPVSYTHLSKTLDQIYDLFAVRIIVDSVKDCYAALGVIHEMYKPSPGRFKDYIAMPKPNTVSYTHLDVYKRQEYQ